MFKEDCDLTLVRKSCKPLNLVLKVGQVKDCKGKIFEGLCCLKNFKYDIDLILNPTFEIKPVRRIPYALRNEVKNELNNMAKLNVIKPIKEATPVVQSDGNHKKK